MLPLIEQNSSAYYETELSVTYCIHSSRVHLYFFADFFESIQFYKIKI